MGGLEVYTSSPPIATDGLVKSGRLQPATPVAEPTPCEEDEQDDEQEDKQQWIHGYAAEYGGDDQYD
jgi:hypothetical protein